MLAVTFLAVGHASVGIYSLAINAAKSSELQHTCERFGLNRMDSLHCHSTKQFFVAWTHLPFAGTCLQWQSALYLLRHLQNASMSPSTTTYNAVTSAVSWQLSSKLLAEMQFRMVQQDVKTGGRGSWSFGLSNLVERDSHVGSTSQRKL